MIIKSVMAAGDALILNIPQANAAEFVRSFKPGEYELKPVKKRRSNDANAYMWALCSKIADAVGTTKEEVYRRNIREGSQFTPLPIKAEYTDEFRRIWQSNGIGWFAEVAGTSKIDGYNLVFAYHGSSTYDSYQMSLLIKRVIQDAESLGIPTITDEEFAELMKGHRYGKTMQALR